MKNDKISRYRMGWLLVMFDLPVMTKQERYEAAKFRNELLDLGYLMLQYSVYARYAATLEKRKSFINSLRKIAPTTGNVNCYFITDTQWTQCITLTNNGKKSIRQIDKNDIVCRQLQFW